MSFAGDAGARPPRVSFANLGTGETFEMPFTPVEVKESLQVKWSRRAPVGMSHEIQQYGNTGNHTFDGLDFFFRGTSPEEVDRIHEGRKFLMSLAYSPEGGGAPPRILFFWPQFISMTCVLGKLQITHSKFNREGRPTVFRARFDLEEARDIRLTQEAVRAQGTQRSAAGSQEI